MALLPQAPDTLPVRFCMAQALDDKAKATACNSSRSCVKSYPVREQYGLIWVWPSAGPAAEPEAAAAGLPLSKGVFKAAEAGQYLRWYRRELEYSWDILIENLTDPCKCCCGTHSTLCVGWEKRAEYCIVMSSAGWPFCPQNDSL